ncbi:hypothetical protein FB451DRAFT_1295745, partial [Mycena latifolia]
MGMAGTRLKYTASMVDCALGLWFLWCRRVLRGLWSLGNHRLGECDRHRHLLWLVGERAGVAAVHHEHRGMMTSGSGAGTGSGGGADSSNAAGCSATEGSGAGDSSACGSNTLWRRCRAEMRRDAGATSTEWGRITIRPEVQEWSRLNAHVPVMESEQSLM